MPFTLTNTLSSGPLVIFLASGATVRLSPGQTSGELADVEVLDNPKIEKLLQRGVLEVHSSEDGVDDKAGSVATTSRPRGTKSASSRAKAEPEQA